jgi:PAS domain S-box-containing protein
MSSDTTIGRSASASGGSALGAEAAEHERQFLELLEFCPAALLVVDEDGRLLFHNARLREILGYSKAELDLCDTRTHWHDLDQRTRIINQLRDQGGQLLNEKVIWRTRKGTLVHLLLSYVQVGYHGGHISFVGGKRVLWVYDVTALTQHELQVAEQERQLREILDYCPAAVALPRYRFIAHGGCRRRARRTRLNRSQALPRIRFERVRCLVHSLGAGMRRQGYLDLRNGVTVCPLAALV